MDPLLKAPAAAKWSVHDLLPAPAETSSTFREANLKNSTVRVIRVVVCEHGAGRGGRKGAGRGGGNPACDHATMMCREGAEERSRKGEAARTESVF